ncbi:MAG: EI24 domain-containing protein [Desulfobacterales bacterium]|jgi:CysZ protein
MDFIRGIKYNLQGFALALKTPRLLLLGLLRFVVMVLITILSAGLILVYHQELINLIWTKPDSAWLVWLWVVVDWLVTVLLIGITVVFAYLLSQILFSVLIMDLMSRITEKLVSGAALPPESASLLQQFFFLVKQEIPRAVIPILIALVFMLIGWLTPLGPVISLLASAAVIVFLAWDATDLTPARRLRPFSERFRFLLKTLPFHLGFGLLFLVPLVNILFLSFAPVGATLYYLKRHKGESVKSLNS